MRLLIVINRFTALLKIHIVNINTWTYHLNFTNDEKTMWYQVHMTPKARVMMLKIQL